METIRIGIAGLGTVGQGLVELIQTRPAKKLGAHVVISKIFVRHIRKKRKVRVPSSLLTSSQVAFHKEPMDVLVEVMGGDWAPREVILQAIERKRHVVSSNKVVLAKFAPEILGKANRHKVNVRFEAACGAGIPILHPLWQDLKANWIKRIIGIVNGTTNYILTTMEKEGKDLEQVLEKAKDLGYAEPDPTDDVEGHDARYKASLLSYMGFGLYVPPEEIYTEGITSIGLADLKYARELGFTVKLLALLAYHNKKFMVRVHPALLPLEHPLASVGGVYNGIFVEADAAGGLMFVGKGAGAKPTASALLSDILQVKQTPRLPPPQPIHPSKFVAPFCWAGPYYMRMEVKDQPGVLAKIARSFGKWGVSIHAVIQKKAFKTTAEIVWLTHQVEEGKMQKALAEIKGLSVVQKVHSLIRVLDA